MDLKANNIGNLLLHFKEIEVPMSLTTADIARIKIELDLISASAKLHGGMIMALVDILVDVFDGLDRSNRLHIDITVILPDEISGVTDHPLVVNLLPTNLIRAPCI